MDLGRKVVTVETAQGLCQCGCGQPAPISKVNDRFHGWTRGEPKRYISGHNARKAERYIVEDRGYLSACWIWQLHVTKKGYAHTCPPGASRPVRAHRLYYEEEYGPIPEGYELDHLCEVKCCVRPSHLEVVTTAENSRRSPATKLNWPIVDAIRRLRTEEGLTYRSLSLRFGVARATVADIIKERTWRD